MHAVYCSALVYAMRCNARKRCVRHITELGLLEDDGLGELRDTFEIFDSDQSGSLDREQIGQLLSVIGVEVGAEELDEAYAAMDADGNGSIEFLEFAGYYASLEVRKYNAVACGAVICASCPVRQRQLLQHHARRLLRRWLS